MENTQTSGLVRSNVSTQDDAGRWVPAEPMPEPIGIRWARLTWDHRMGYRGRIISIFLGFRDALREARS